MSDDEAIVMGHEAAEMLRAHDDRVREERDRAVAALTALAGAVDDLVEELRHPEGGMTKYARRTLAHQIDPAMHEAGALLAELEGGGSS